MAYLCICTVVLGVLALALLGKLFLLRRGIKKLAEDLNHLRKTDTNMLLTLSCRDKGLRQLVSCLNRELSQLRRERLRYQQGDREVKEAVVNISHDLRTPLTAISGYLELLEKENLPENAARYVGQISQRSDAMKKLTEELFRYSMAASDSLSLQPVDFCRIVEETLLSFYGALAGKGISPQVILPERPVICMADTGALQRILGNLLTNAMKYSDGDLTVQLTETGKLLFSNHAAGLDQIRVGRLFHRFYTVASGEDSTGLGLSIARTLTEKMGGEIDAALEGDILTVWVAFPPVEKK